MTSSKIIWCTAVCLQRMLDGVLHSGLGSRERSFDESDHLSAGFCSSSFSSLSRFGPVAGKFLASSSWRLTWYVSVPAGRLRLAVLRPFRLRHAGFLGSRHVRRPGMCLVQEEESAQLQLALMWTLDSEVARCPTGSRHVPPDSEVLARYLARSTKRTH